MFCKLLLIILAINFALGYRTGYLYAEPENLPEFDEYFASCPMSTKMLIPMEKGYYTAYSAGYRTSYEIGCFVEIIVSKPFRGCWYAGMHANSIKRQMEKHERELKPSPGKKSRASSGFFVEL